MSWVPVSERLPESGQYVLCFVDGRAGPEKNTYRFTRRIRAFYAGKFTIEEDFEDDSFDYNEEKDVYYLPEGWYESNQYEEAHWKVTDPVTHWMPLPEPPTPIGQER